MAKPARREQNEDLIKAYKARLAAVIDRRPSGTRQRLADALGAHRSFVSQITGAMYSTPVPARHLPTIFAVCHFSAEERRSFLEAYHAAHPERADAPASGQTLRHITLVAPDLGEPERNRAFDEALADFARRMAALLAPDVPEQTDDPDDTGEDNR